MYIQWENNIWIWIFQIKSWCKRLTITIIVVIAIITVVIIINYVFNHLLI